MRISDWSSDVCSSDLRGHAENRPGSGCRGFPGATDWAVARIAALISIAGPKPGTLGAEGGCAAQHGDVLRSYRCFADSRRTTAAGAQHEYKLLCRVCARCSETYTSKASVSRRRLSRSL